MRIVCIFILLSILFSCKYSADNKIEKHTTSIEKKALPMAQHTVMQETKIDEVKPSAGTVYQIEYFGIYLAHLPDSFSITSRPKKIEINNEGPYEINITMGPHFVATLEIRPFSNVIAMYLDKSPHDIDGARASRTLQGKNVIYQMEAETTESPLGIVLSATVSRQYESWFRNSLKFHAPGSYDRMVISSYDQILPVIYPQHHNSIIVQWVTTIARGNKKLGLLFTNTVSGNTTTLQLEYVMGEIEFISMPVEIDTSHNLACRFWYGGQGKTYQVKLEGDSLNVYRKIEEETSEAQQPQLLKTIPVPDRTRLSLITYKPEKVCAS